MRMYEVRSRLRETNAIVRDNGVLGPFRTREAAERALIALCQAGQATTGNIVPVEEPDDTPLSPLGGPQPV